MAHPEDAPNVPFLPSPIASTDNSMMERPKDMLINEDGGLF